MTLQRCLKVVIVTITVFSLFIWQEVDSIGDPGVTGDNWGPWTTWTNCSKACHGVSYRQRICHESTNEGDTCIGDSKQYQTCNNKGCPNLGEGLSEGLAECLKLDEKIFGGQRFFWKPVLNPYKRCQLSCKAKGRHYYKNTNKTLSDGTPCKETNTSYCLHGACVAIGCDGLLGSDARIDKCGVCGGNGNSCQVKSGIFSRSHLTKYHHHYITKIPAGACNINITETARSHNYIALKLDNGQYLLNSKTQISLTGTYLAVGTEFSYHRNTGASCPGECIYAPGPTDNSIDIEVLYYDRNPGIVYQFTIPQNEVAKLDVQSSSTSSSTKTQHRGRRHRKNRHRKHRKNHHRTKNKHDSRTGDGQSEQSDAVLERKEHGSTRDDRYIIKRRIDADRLNPRIQESPRYIPNTRHRYQQQVLGGSRHHQNQLNDRYLSSGHGRDGGVARHSGGVGSRDRGVARHSGGVGSRDGVVARHLGGVGSRDGVVARTGQIIIPSTRDSQQLLLSNANDPYATPLVGSNTVLESHDRTLIDATGEYSWRISGFSECSRSCGGGTQETRVLCMKGISNLEVTAENCDPSKKPETQTVECNKTPCQADWYVGDWAECSVTCGAGKQNRLVECRRRISPTLDLSVSASLCLHLPKPQRIKPCTKQACATWKSGNWSKCSADCGHGQRTRSVTCVNVEGLEIDEQECDHQQPPKEEICDMGSCAKGWYHTRWSDECSSHCGRGFYTRSIYCAADDGSSLPERKCPRAQKPKIKKVCKSSQPCGGNWFTGPWSKCNATCGIGAMERGVACMKKLRSDVYTIVKDVNCLIDEKPVSVKGCEELPPCQSRWYMTEYSQCSKSCGTGVKRREVKCLNSNLEPDMTCTKSKKPSERQSCNKQSCDKTNFTLQKDSGGDKGQGCTDSYQNWCQFVRQARICGYKYYQKQCCKSCQEYL